MSYKYGLNIVFLTVIRNNHGYEHDTDLAFYNHQNRQIILIFFSEFKIIQNFITLHKCKLMPSKMRSQPPWTRDSPNVSLCSLFYTAEAGRSQSVCTSSGYCFIRALLPMFSRCSTDNGTSLCRGFTFVDICP